MNSARGYELADQPQGQPVISTHLAPHDAPLRDRADRGYLARYDQNYAPVAVHTTYPWLTYQGFHLEPRYQQTIMHRNGSIEGSSVAFQVNADQLQVQHLHARYQQVLVTNEHLQQQVISLQEEIRKLKDSYEEVKRGLENSRIEIGYLLGKEGDGMSRQTGSESLQQKEGLGLRSKELSDTEREATQLARNVSTNLLARNAALRGYIRALGHSGEL